MPISFRPETVRKLGKATDGRALDDLRDISGGFLESFRFELLTTVQLRRAHHGIRTRAGGSLMGSLAHHLSASPNAEAAVRCVSRETSSHAPCIGIQDNIGSKSMDKSRARGYDL
jgi:hypothetical protein